MKIVINACYGGFTLSDEAKKRLNLDDFDEYDDSMRSNEMLVKVVEELGEAASGNCSNLIIVEIPDDVEWHIEEYDGLEHIAENHRTWHSNEEYPKDINSSDGEITLNMEDVDNA